MSILSAIFLAAVSVGTVGAPVFMAGDIRGAGAIFAASIICPGVLSDVEKPDADGKPAAAQEGTLVIDANDKAVLLEKIGQEAEVRGRLGQIGALNEEFIVFLNFVGNARGDFCGIVRRDDLPALRMTLGENFPYDLKGSLVVLSGPVTDYRGTPQIEIKEPGQIRVLEHAQPGE